MGILTEGSWVKLPILTRIRKPEVPEKNSDILEKSKKSIHWKSMGNRYGQPDISLSKQTDLISASQ